MVHLMDTRFESLDPVETSLRSTFCGVGIEWDMLSNELRHRFMKLAKETATVDDEIKALEYADQLEGYLTAEELRVVQRATLCTDIGKTGPREASPGQEDFVTRVYAIRENIKGGPGAVTLEQFLGTYYPDSLMEDLELARGMGMDPQETMRTFFNRHAGWTLELLEASDLPDDVIIAAANHHFLEGVSPKSMIDKQGMITYRETRRPFGRQEAIVILLDKYDARRARGGDTHEAAIVWLRKFLTFPDVAARLATYPSDVSWFFEEGIDTLEVQLQDLKKQKEELSGKMAAA